MFVFLNRHRLIKDNRVNDIYGDYFVVVNLLN